MAGNRYKTPGAFRRALTDTLRSRAAESRWSLPQLQRQIGYDRLLQRLYLVDDGWIVKGATALVARGLGMRATVDIDPYRAAAHRAAEGQLRDAAAQDIGDWFRFEVAVSKPVADGTSGVRLPVAAYVGPIEWVRFHVDLVGSDVRMTGQPDAVGPLAPITLPGVEQQGYRAYPLVDHIADKVLATFQRYGTGRRPSTRYRDLVDLVSIVTGVSVDAQAQLEALASEAVRRDVDLPDHFDVPDRALWAPGYASEAARSVLPIARSLDDALSIVRPFLDPLLSGTATGSWNPRNRGWTS